MDERPIRRLVLVKRLHLEAEKYSDDDTEFGRIISIILLDNCIEQLLVLVCHHLNEKITDKDNFDTLWKKCDTALNKRMNYALPYYNQMTRLHRIRNNAQHSGIVPDSSEVKECKQYTLDFLRESIKQIFEIELSELYLSLLIKNQKVKECLIEAENYLGKNESKTSMNYSALAFKIAILDEKSRIHGSGWSFIKSFGLLSDSNIRKIEDCQVKESLETIEEKFNQLINALDNELEVLKLRMDYKKYRHFESISPCIFAGLNDSSDKSKLPDLYEKVGDTDKKNYTRENAIFCLEFVIDTILRWESFYRPSWWESYSSQKRLATE